MRYIIIPIAIILYLWSSYKSIKDIRDNTLSCSKEMTVMWTFFTIATLLTTITIYIALNFHYVLEFFIKYW